MSGLLLALGLAAGALGLIEPLFRPIAAVTVLLGAILALGLLWRHRRATHPSISSDTRTGTDGRSH